MLQKVGELFMEQIVEPKSRHRRAGST